MQSLPALEKRRLKKPIIGIALVLATLFQVASAATLPPVTLAWNQNPEADIAGYDLSYGTVSGTHGTTIRAGLTTSTTVSGLTEGVTYYFVVVAYNTSGLRSQPSAEISYRGTIATPNQAPDSTISAPSANTTITAGGSVSFAGSGSDPDGNTPLTYLWNFGSGSGLANSTSQNPGSRQFNTPGVYQVTLTVTDAKGLADPTPAQRTITVNAPPANQAPNSTISAPSANTTITAGGSVSFAGSGSDPDGNTPLTYLWNFGSGSGLANSTSQNPGSRQFNTPGVYQVTLTVTDAKGLADPTPAQRTITVNAPPVINQAPDSTISSPSANVTILTGGIVGFSGSGSDPDGNTPLTYRWNFGSGSGLSDSTSQNPGSRQFNTPGVYQVTLTVTDAKGLVDPTPAQRTITVNAPPANQAPDSTISAPSSNVSILAGGTVGFSGSGSDPDANTPLTYRWNFGSGSGLVDSSSQNPGTRQFNTPGTYLVTLTVTDSRGLADPTPAQRTITVNPPVVANVAPNSLMSNPSANVSISVGDSVSFAGSGVDPDGDTPLSYRWSFGTGSGIADSTAQNPGSRTFGNPGTYQVSLTVTDSKGLADPTPVTRTVTVLAPEPPPSSLDPDWITQPTANVSIPLGGSVKFAGQEAEGRSATLARYRWNFGVGSGIADSTSRNPGNRQFDVPGSHTVTYTVTDSKGSVIGGPARRVITVGGPPVATNQAPDSTISSPSSNVSITAGGSVSFAGSGSDPDGNTPLTYRWSFGSGSGLPDSTSQNPGSLRFNTPGVYQVTLTATDSKGLADPVPAQRTVTVTAPVVTNQAPDSAISAPFASSINIAVGASVSFAGVGSDPDGNTPLSYRWNFGSGSGIADSTLQNPGSLQFDKAGTFVVTLTVTDSKGLADPSPPTRTIIVSAPEPSIPGLEGWITNPPENLSIQVGDSVVFSGGGTDKYGATRMTYHWSFGSGSGISNSSSQNPGSRTFDNPGIFEVTLTVTDSRGVTDPSPARRIITVGVPQPPSTGGAAGVPVLATMSIDGAVYPTVSFTKKGGTQPTVEVSSNLKDWFSGPDHVVVITDDETTLKVRGKQPMSTTPCCYFRLKLNASAP